MIGLMRLYRCIWQLWGLRPPRPRERGVSPLRASDFFDAEKVTKKAPGTPRSPIFVLTGLYQIWDISAPNQVFTI